MALAQIRDLHGDRYGVSHRTTPCGLSRLLHAETHSAVPEQAATIRVKGTKRARDTVPVLLPTSHPGPSLAKSWAAFAVSRRCRQEPRADEPARSESYYSFVKVTDP
jgi:hypothetical protein